MPQDAASGIDERSDSGIDRRTFLGAAGAAGIAATVPAVGAAGTSPRAKIDGDLDTSGDAQEILVVFTSNDAVRALGDFSLPKGYHRFSVLPIGYAVATGDQIERIARLDTVLSVEANRDLEFYNDDARGVTGSKAVQTDCTKGGKAHVAVIDSGLSGLHPDHQENVRHNYKYTNPLDRDTTWVDVGTADTDDNGHGTHVSGTIAGDGTQSDGQYKGHAPDADLTVYSTGVTLAVVNSIAAFDHILENHTKETAANADEVVQLTSNSYGPTSGNGQDFSPVQAINVATYRTYQAGILSLFAAGNSGPANNTLSEYAKAPWVLGVAATDDEKAVTGFSSRGRPSGFDGETNYDRDLALSNAQEFYASRFADPTAEESTGQTYTAAGTTAGAVGVGLNQTTPPFTVQSYSGSFTPDAYEVRATLTWNQDTEGPQANDADFDLLDSNGNVVASSGSGGTETQDQPRETLTGTVDPGSEYHFQVTGWRGAVQYEVDAEVYIVQYDSATPSPPYGLYRPGVGAPGNLIVSTMSPNDPLQAETDGTVDTETDPYYATISGTSMATPATSGIAALIISTYHDEYGVYPEPKVLLDVLEDSAEFLSSKDHKVHTIGRGFVDATVACRIADVTDDPTADDGDGDDGEECVDDGNNGHGDNEGDDCSNPGKGDGDNGDGNSGNGNDDDDEEAMAMLDAWTW